MNIADLFETIILGFIAGIFPAVGVIVVTSLAVSFGGSVFAAVLFGIVFTVAIVAEIKETKEGFDQAAAKGLIMLACYLIGYIWALSIQ